MSTRLALVCACLLFGTGSGGAQQGHPPETITSRSVSVEQAPRAVRDPAREEWVDHVISKFFDDEASGRAPAR